MVGLISPVLNPDWMLWCKSEVGKLFTRREAERLLETLEVIIWRINHWGNWECFIWEGEWIKIILAIYRQKREVLLAIKGVTFPGLSSVFRCPFRCQLMLFLYIPSISPPSRIKVFASGTGDVWSLASSLGVYLVLRALWRRGWGRIALIHPENCFLKQRSR